MLSTLKLIFVHGVNEQMTNYSQELYLKILAAARRQLQFQGIEETQINDILQRLVQHEVLYADLTTSLIDRYMQLQYYQTPRIFWNFLTKPIDPLALQIMHYIKDKGDKQTGRMNILREFDSDIQRIFDYEDVGKDPRRKEGENALFIAHSLGSVVAYDYVMCFRKEYRLKKNITVKSFITMGSPIPLFTSAMGHPDSEINLPPNVHKWVNIISPHDGIARYIKPFFKQIPIEEHEVYTGFFPLSAHTRYWKSDATALIIAKEALAALGYPLSK